MGRKYASVGNQAVGTNITVIGVTSTAAIMPKLYELVVGCGAAPADLTTIFHVERYTAAGTATAVTPQALDPTDPAATASAGENHTVEPTYTASAVLMKFPVHQRNTFRWIARPGYELVMPPTANNGLGLQSQSSGGTAAHDATFFHEE